MKKLFFVLFAITLLTFSKSGFAQLSATTLSDIIDSVTSRVNYLETKQDKEVVNVTIDLLVGTQGTKMVYRYLDNGFDYNVLLIGDRRISELKMVVSRKSGDNWIKVDRSNGTNPELSIYPDERALYEFIISADNFNDDYSAGHFALLLYHIDPDKGDK
jgi:hypothetical protein